MEEALSGMSLTDVEIETTFLDITTSNSVAEPIMATAAASVHSDTLILVNCACLCDWLFSISDMNQVTIARALSELLY